VNWTLYRKLAGPLVIAFDSFEGRCVYRCRKFLEKTQWMKKKDLQRLQIRRLKALLRHAYENVPYYHESFRKENFRPADFKCLKDLCKVPILKKSVIREQLNGMVAKNVRKRDLVQRFTSGTTATPVKFYRSKKDVSWGIAAELRGYGWAGYEIGDKLALMWRIKPKQIGSFKFKIKNLLRRHKILNTNHLSEKSMEPFAKEMHGFQPDFIRSYASTASIFATFMLQNKHLKICPQAVFTSGQTLLPHYQKAIEETFNCEVYDYYATSEVSHIAAQCRQREGLHIFEENVVVEIVKDDELASPGEEGQVLLTNLHSYAMPFIRYDVEDLGKILPDTCSCGRELSLLKVIGRNYEYFVNRDGSFTYLYDLQTIFEDLPIKDFQIVQENYDEIIIKIVSRPGYTKAHTDFILKNIKIFGPAKIRVELVDSISLEKSGKIQHAVSKLATRYT
jgi:phenylacetate-CoA ligase